jgi:hypothetical protein
VSFDLRSIAVPLDSPPIRRMRADEQAWQEASERPPFVSQDWGEPLPEISRELMDIVPRRWTWSFPDRSHSQAEYLLDPAGSRALASWAERERSRPFRIIEGDEPFADHARGAQGVPWRCSRASFLIEAADVIQTLDAAMARREFSVAEMDSSGVYKTRPDEDDDEAFERLSGHLGRLARYYRDVAGRGLDLIVERD